MVTAGRWESAGAHGAYRILLFHGGLEHTNSTVVAEWVADPTHDTDRRVVYSKLLVDTCLCSLKPPQVEPLPIGVRVTLTGELTAMPQNVTCIFELGQSGQVRVLRQC